MSKSLEKMTIKELKNLLRSKKMPLSGNKGELLKRLKPTSSVKDITKELKTTSSIKRIKLGNLIININNNLGGVRDHVDVIKHAKQADKLDQRDKEEIVQKLKPHIDKVEKIAENKNTDEKEHILKHNKVDAPRAKKFPPVEVGKPIDKKSLETVKPTDKRGAINDELKKIKKSEGISKEFLKNLEGIFGKR